MIVTSTNIPVDKVETYKKNELLEWLKHILIAIILAWLILTFVGQRTVVFEHSMEPTLYDGDNLILDKISLRFTSIKRGDIVTIVNASSRLEEQHKTVIKRVIALSGETVEIKNGDVYVNHKLLDEKYARKDNFEMEKIIVPEHCVFVLGDNRGQSEDSRRFGPVDINKITSKAVFRFYPFNKLGLLN